MKAQTKQPTAEQLLDEFRGGYDFVASRWEGLERFPDSSDWFRKAWFYVANNTLWLKIEGPRYQGSIILDGAEKTEVLATQAHKAGNLLALRHLREMVVDCREFK